MSSLSVGEPSEPLTAPSSEAGESAPVSVADPADSGAPGDVACSFDADTEAPGIESGDGSADGWHAARLTSSDANSRIAMIFRVRRFMYMQSPFQLRKVAYMPSLIGRHHIMV
jgi:hypothetical protein